MEFIKLRTSDNLELSGMFFKPKINTNKCVIYIHGMADNFYEKSFIVSLSKAAIESGYSFLTFNNRGHDYFSDIRKWDNDKLTIESGGAAYEIFEESKLDLDAAIKHVEAQGYNEIILLGHSLGCNKIINYYKNHQENIVKIILLAPSDIVGQCIFNFKEEYPKIINHCQSLLDENKGSSILRVKESSPVGFSAKTIIHNFCENENIDIFRYRDFNYVNKDLESISIPTLIIFGASDHQALLINLEETEEFLKNNFAKAKLDIKSIPNANHFFTRYENELEKIVKDWLD